MTYRPGWARRDPRRLHAVTHLLPPQLRPIACACCGYGGWYGSRWHNPAHHSPHRHCACGRPCTACAKGDGFHRSKPDRLPDHLTHTSRHGLG